MTVGLEDRHSNSPIAIGSDERTLTGEMASDWIAKGLVSARIEAFQKNIEQQGSTSHLYPPSFPRARLERVHTQEDWPSYNTDLYTHQHPRTMSLASNSSRYTAMIPRHREHGYASGSRMQADSDASGSPRVTTLLHLWESKGRTQPAPKASRIELFASTEDLTSFMPRPSQDHRSPYRMNVLPEVRKPSLSSNSMPQHGRSLASQSSNLQADVCGQDPIILRHMEINANADGEHAKHGGGTCIANNGTANIQDNLTIDTRHQLHEQPPALINMKEKSNSSDVLYASARSLPFQLTRSGTAWQESGPHNLSVTSKLEGNQLERRITTQPSSSDDHVNASYRGRSKTRRGTRAGSPPRRPDWEIEPLIRPSESSDNASPQNTEMLENIERGTSGAHRSPVEARMALAESRSPEALCGPRQLAGDVTASASRLIRLRDTLPRCSASWSSASIRSTSSDTPIHRRRLLKGRQCEESRSSAAMEQAATAHGTIDPSMHTTSTSSSEYYSMDQSKPANGGEQTERWAWEDASAQRRIKQDKVAPKMPSGVDAATQTDIVDQNAGETVSRSSDKDSIAQQGRQQIYHRVSRPIRLERRLRRPTVRKVQVIISLDGATDLVVDAKLRRIHPSRVEDGGHGLLNKPDAPETPKGPSLTPPGGCQAGNTP